MIKPQSERDSFRVGLIGAGLQGKRRAPVLKQFPNTELVIVASAYLDIAKKLAADAACEATDRWQDVIERDDINAVMVCTPPNLHAEISIAAMKRAKHVLCEKPLTRTVKEAVDMIKVAKDNNVILKCGFNHRHHPAIQKAKEYVDEGLIGGVDFIRCSYGIGGRPGYEKEWRADTTVVSGGQLMEQGIHAVDLFRWFLGEFEEVVGFTATRYWNISPLEDNAFAMFRTAKGQIASLHSSLTQWKNMFRFEIYGQDGYILVEGLGGGYGMEQVTIGKKNFYDPFKDETTEFRGGDNSWYEEWKEFVSAIEEKREPLGNGYDGLEALKLVNSVYESASKHIVWKSP
ncbi:Gfo/Idh/MocA family protein [Chloroflexota bacterium]